ncbi:hypothetical protein EJ04DRAFT_474489 [Polyplosphaeria fusca]|uniref:DUF3844 domain-containing protein n=1 Tax=Polyplosphaeria fusca TaxID=682080 RepID=A0A9P4UYG6_9PLEO|nr:hypothetical protein EJ04DRAFT_474489 [Polyplosphaeria fusca]
MKLSCGLLLSSLYCSASAASQAGHVFIFNSGTVQQAWKPEPQTVDPETARLIFAQRLGLARFHSIKSTDDEVVRQIARYGGIPQRPFGGESLYRINNAHTLIWIEDVEDPKAIISNMKPYTANFTISNPPSTSDNDRLVQDFTLQAESLPAKEDYNNWAYDSGVETEQALMSLKHVDSYRINKYLNIFRADKSDKVAPSSLSSAISQIMASATKIDCPGCGFSVTVVLMPPTSPKTKRAAQPYGTYDVPMRREARRQKTEALLSPASSTPPKPQSSVVWDLEDFPAITAQDDDSPVLGILPACFESKELCQVRTKNCSGHGGCGSMHKGAQDCFGCRCEATVEQVGDNEKTIKTTYWGGPACQKKDVSVPFWLFVGSGVIIAALISAGIGMLYSMGSEELPSVIGAGVSGPQRK